MKKIMASLLVVISCTLSPVFAAPQESMEEKTLETHIAETISDVIEVAYNEVGYLEKSSNSNLYDKTANAGSNNYTKYANDLSSWGFYSGGMNGLAWCDMFVDWCLATTFGAESAKNISYQTPYGSAACETSMSYYKSVGQFYETPQPGDQIFFTNGYQSNHTGLVYKVDNNTVYTIEGNTSSSPGVVPNGGAVSAKSYELTSSRIAGYGRPNYIAIANQKKIEYDILLEQKRQEEIKAQQEALRLQKEQEKQKLREQLSSSPKLMFDNSQMNLNNINKDSSFNTILG